MKKITFIFAATVLAFSATGFAQGYGSAGCGLGSMLFKENKKLHQVLAATTNGTFGSQTFGITTGTLNCTSDGVAKVEREAEMFAEANLDLLKRELAAGNGETLAAFSEVIGCESEASLANALRDNYSEVLEVHTAQDLLSVVKKAMQNDESLARSCS